MNLNDLFGPSRLDERQNGDDLTVGQNILVHRHSRFVSVTNKRLETILRHLEQILIGVVPSMAGLIMRWSGQVTVLISFVPIRLPFEALPMATGALLSIEN